MHSDILNQLIYSLIQSCTVIWLLKHESFIQSNMTALPCLLIMWSKDTCSFFVYAFGIFVCIEWFFCLFFCITHGNNDQFQTQIWKHEHYVFSFIDHSYSFRGRFFFKFIYFIIYDYSFILSFYFLRPFYFCTFVWGSFSVYPN